MTALPESSTAPALLVLDGAYTLETLRKLGNERSVTCRDLGGFFRHVWNVHPLASRTTSPQWAPRYGRPDWHQLAPRHTFIEGKIGRFAWLARVFPLNFAIAQIGLFFTLLALIRRERIAIVRVGDPLYLGLMGWALARLGGAKLAIRVNGNNDQVRLSTGRPLYPQLFRSIRIEQAIEGFVFPRADLVAAPNQDNVDYAVRRGARPERTTIFRYGNLIADEHLLPPEARSFDPALLGALGIEKGRYLLSVGRVQAVKFPDDAVRALAALKERGHDLKLVFAGDGPMREDLQALGASLGVGDRLVFAGNQNQASLAQLMPQAAAVLSPLTGRALSECALGGAAIVAYDLDWQSDLIQTGATGELVPFRDPDGLAAAAARFVEDPAYARAMGAGARTRAMEMLNPAELDDHERAVFSQLLSPR
jgi:glycosyltransferase involved in cell wall biosynthesis